MQIREYQGMMKKALSALLVIAAVTFNPANASESLPTCSPPPKKPPPTTTRVPPPSITQEVNVHYDRQEPLPNCCNCCNCSASFNNNKEVLIYDAIKSQIDLLITKITKLENNTFISQSQPQISKIPEELPKWNWLSFEKFVPGFFSFIAKIAWPAVALIVFILLKSHIIMLLSRIKKGKIGNAEVEFNESARAAKEEAEEFINLESKGISPEYVSQIANNPRALVISKWVEIEMALKELVDTKIRPEPVPGNYTLSPRKYNVVSTIRAVQRNKLLSDNYIPLIHELRVMRNEAAHAENFMLSPDAVAAYVEIADRILGAIRGELYSRPDKIV